MSGKGGATRIIHWVPLMVFNLNPSRYAAPMEKPTLSDTRAQAVYAALRAIPPGRVTAYGTLAAYAGLPGYGRYVGRLLRDLPGDSSLPWHRVLRSSGRIAFPIGSHSFYEQKKCLENEGIPVNNGRVSMRHYQWQP